MINLLPNLSLRKHGVNMKHNKKLGTFIIDLLFDIAGGLLYSTGIYTFAHMADFAPGGISGLALILNHLLGLPIGLMTLALNIPLVIISYKVVGREFLLKTARSMIICTIFLDVIFPHTTAYSGSPFMAALYSGLCMGAGMAFFYMRGSSSGGADFLIMTIKVRHPYFSLGTVSIAIDLLIILLGWLRHPYFSLGTVSIAIDLLIILLGWPVFQNVDAVLYGLASAFVGTVVLDKIMYGVGAGKLIIIITNQGQQIADRIGQITDRGSTIIKAMGSYTREDRDVLLCACSKSQSYTVTGAAHELDPGAFIMVTETSEVFGEGFIEKMK